MRFMAQACVVLMVAMLSACENSPLPPDEDVSQGVTSPVASLSSAPISHQEMRGRGVESEYVAIEELVPGFGGAYLDEEGNLVAVLRDLSLSDRAVDVIETTFLADPLRAQYLRNSAGVRPVVKVVRGEYSMSELIVWNLSLYRASKAVRLGIAILDADERRNRLRVALIDESYEPVLTAVAAQLGIPAGAIFIDREAGWATASGHVQNDSPRPTISGFQTRINPVAGQPACTLGFNVRDASFVKYALTAAHCTNSFTGSTGTSFYQNGTSFLQGIGSITLNPAWSTSCSMGVDYCAVADVALIDYFGGVASVDSVAETSSIGNQTMGSLSGTVNRLVASTMTPAVGAPARKTGRTTGTTGANISNTCVTVGYNHNADSLQVTCAVSADMFCDRGDSGGPVFGLPGEGLPPTWRFAYGSLFACSANTNPLVTYFSPWTSIETHLGLGLVPG